MTLNFNASVESMTEVTPENFFKFATVCRAFRRFLVKHGSDISVLRVEEDHHGPFLYLEVFAGKTAPRPVVITLTGSAKNYCVRAAVRIADVKNPGLLQLMLLLTGEHDYQRFKLELKKDMSMVLHGEKTLSSFRNPDDFRKLLIHLVEVAGQLEAVV